MGPTARRTPERALRFAIRCGDRELAELLSRALTAGSDGRTEPLAQRTFARLAGRLGIS